MDSFALQSALGLVLGLIGLLSNLLVIILIVKCKELHFNAYYLTGALASTDLLNGLVFMITGAYSLYLVRTNQTEATIPARDCLYYPSDHYFPIPYHAGSMMMLLIAGDRFLSVSAVGLYFKLGNKYTIGLIGFCVSYTIGVWSYFTYDLIAVVSRDLMVSKSCVVIYTESVHAYDYYGTTALVTGAVVIMMCTWIVLRWKSRSYPQSQQQTAASSQVDGSIDRNAKAARLLAMISLNTFCMWVVPDTLVAILEPYEWSSSIVPYFWLLQPAHATTNLAIYFRKGSQLRHALEEMRKKKVQVQSTSSMYGQ